MFPSPAGKVLTIVRGGGHGGGRGGGQLRGGGGRGGDPRGQ